MGNCDLYRDRISYLVNHHWSDLAMTRQQLARVSSHPLYHVTVMEHWKPTLNGDLVRVRAHRRYFYTRETAVEYADKLPFMLYQNDLVRYDIPGY